MRIVGGDFGGRRLKVPRTDAVRPPQDSVREALSRGAKSATFVELNRRHLAVVRENAAALAAGRDARFVAADCARYLASYSGPGFDIE